ncbi:signal recognition particle receptor subunit alpha, partial [Actinomyces denticolens]
MVGDVGDLTPAHTCGDERGDHQGRGCTGADPTGAAPESKHRNHGQDREHHQPVLSRGDLSESDWEEIEDTLLTSDLGVEVTMELMDGLRTQAKVLGT